MNNLPKLTETETRLEPDNSGANFEACSYACSHGLICSGPCSCHKCCFHLKESRRVEKDVKELEQNFSFFKSDSSSSSSSSPCSFALIKWLELACANKQGRCLAGDIGCKQQICSCNNPWQLACRRHIYIIKSRSLVSVSQRPAIALNWPFGNMLLG